jgi:sterol desaturase/sphingolipid hydroxylase (fatty acid hydroxylase superfamily)
MNLIVLAIPVFFLLIAIELVAARVLEKDAYRLSDSVSDLSCGILDQLVDVFFKTLLFAGYLYLFEHYRFFTVPREAVWAWATCFLGVDFLYYWFHRWSHEVNAGWAAHVVHHQSEEYNLSVALRQGSFQQAFSWVFYLPLALLGFPPLMFLTCSSLNTLYQFWIHTRLIGRLGPLEWVLNTPSHHRVHHGRNPKYIDKNHAGTLIVWDRLFGTFKQEDEEPVYGITSPLRSANPVWANLRHWVELVRLSARTKRLRDRLLVFWKPPGWRPADLGGFEPAPEVDRATYQKYEVGVPLRTKVYVLAQFLALNLATLLFLQRQDALGNAGRVLGALGIVATVVALGALLDRRAAATALEAGRLLLVGGTLAAFTAPGPLAWGTGAFVAVSLAGLYAARATPAPGIAAVPQRS